MYGSHLSILHVPVQELVEWADGHGPAPLPELASWPSPRPTTHSLDNVAAPSTWGNFTNQTDRSSLPNRRLVPPTTTDARHSGQTAPTTELISPHSSHTSSLQTNDPSIDVAIRLIKPRQTKGCAVILPRIETHVYFDIDLPSRSWNAIQLPLTKSVTSDDSSCIGEGIKPLRLLIIVRGATTRQECSRVCEKCERRMGNKTGSPSMIDFHSPSNILIPKLGVVQVHFTFSCYSRHHIKEDEQYLLEVILEDTSNPSGPIAVARKELPYSFDVNSSKLRIKEPTSDQTRKPTSAFIQHLSQDNGRVRRRI